MKLTNYLTVIRFSGRREANDFHEDDSQEDSDEWVIAWDSPRGRYFAGTVHDWEKTVKAPGVIKGPKTEIADHATEYIWERPITIVPFEEPMENVL